MSFNIFTLFTEHPREVNETYWEHARFTALVAFSLIGYAVIVAIHGLLPFLFKHTASRGLQDLCNMITNR